MDHDKIKSLLREMREYLQAQNEPLLDRAYDLICALRTECDNQETRIVDLEEALPEWQPIETAPREETVLVAGGDAPYPVTACWSGLSDECWMVDGQEDVRTEIGWPTHWMPLPAPPKLKG